MLLFIIFGIGPIIVTFAYTLRLAYITHAPEKRAAALERAKGKGTVYYDFAQRKYTSRFITGMGLTAFFFTWVIAVDFYKAKHGVSSITGIASIIGLACGGTGTYLCSSSLKNKKKN